jgi:site-specific recombinase XerD
LERFEVYLSSSALAPATVVNYLADLRAFLRWSEETGGTACSPFELETPDIRDYCSYLQNVKMHAPATINRRLQALRKFYGLAVEQGWTLTNPAESVPLLSDIVSERSRSLTSEDVACLLAAVRGGRRRGRARDWAIIQILLGAGLKLSELTQVRLSDVHLDVDLPHLSVCGDDGNPGRTIPLEDGVSDALHSYLTTRQAAQGVDHLFVNRDGKPLSIRSVQRLLSHYAKKAGLDGLTTQALRYVYARRVYESHGDLRVVARRLGHRHLATTIRYLRPNADE